MESIVFLQSIVRFIGPFSKERTFRFIRPWRFNRLGSLPALVRPSSHKHQLAGKLNTWAWHKVAQPVGRRRTACRSCIRRCWSKPLKSLKSLVSSFSFSHRTVTFRRNCRQDNSTPGTAMCKRNRGCFSETSPLTFLTLTC
jgi:hypothetical protein